MKHQDPASPNAAAVNKAIVLELARQIASVGGDPQIALKSGTCTPPSSTAALRVKLTLTVLSQLLP